ncbi:membrane protein [Cloacibacterium rupense]|uniref:Membrane protein n=1 Tax=Cloacibacterium rupense TaxID=517423 RepID=A0ABQ2NNM7_9FLAO|nr:threonine/serine exporter family protein [Cloacibacterium rupense]GGP05886.1 membrane protein [Cloacibacterium rupense]
MEIDAREKPQIEKYNELLLDIGSTLMISGANCGRIDRNIKRIADVLGLDIESFFSFNGIILTTKMKDNPSEKATHYKRLPSHGVHFGILTETSLLSWRAVSDGLSYDEIYQEFENIKKIKHHNRYQTLILVALACASLCLLAGGDIIDASFALVGSFLGLFTRQELIKKKFNLMIAIILASLVTCVVCSVNVFFNIGAMPEKGLATAVLYLIPGVPLVNGVTDFIEGYVTTGLARGFHAGFILLCIAVGMAISILIFGIDNF